MTTEIGVELAAMLSVLLRRAVAREQIVLDAHDLAMWDYAVLYALRDGPAGSQAELADATGRDRTRLISHLDHLEGRGLVARTPDPQDRRHHVIALTDDGRSLVRTCHARIKEGESEVLAALSEAEGRQLLQMLATATRVVETKDAGHDPQ